MSWSDRRRLGEVDCFSQMAKSGLCKIIFEEDLNHTKNPARHPGEEHSWEGKSRQEQAWHVWSVARCPWFPAWPGQWARAWNKVVDDSKAQSRSSRPFCKIWMSFKKQWGSTAVFSSESNCIRTKTKDFIFVYDSWHTSPETVESLAWKECLLYADGVTGGWGYRQFPHGLIQSVANDFYQSSLCNETSLKTPEQQGLASFGWCPLEGIGVPHPQTLPVNLFYLSVPESYPL